MKGLLQANNKKGYFVDLCLHFWCLYLQSGGYEIIQRVHRGVGHFFQTLLQVGTGYQLAGVVPKIMGSTGTGATLWVWVPKLSGSIWYQYFSYSFFSSYESILLTKAFLLQLVFNFRGNSVNILHLICSCILIALQIKMQSLNISP